MKKPGRPRGSKIRQNIIEILYFLKQGYGYEIHKKYLDIYGPVAQKSIYYNLSMGVKTEEFTLVEIKKEKGEYSWGAEVEKLIYSLGPNAAPRLDSQAKEYFDKK